MTKDTGKNIDVPSIVPYLGILAPVYYNAAHIRTRFKLDDSPRRRKKKQGKIAQKTIETIV